MNPSPGIHAGRRPAAKRRERTMKRYLPLVILLALAPRAAAQADLVSKAEQQRVAVVEKLKPAVVAVTSGTGSGVLISDDGYCLTNFHVTQAARTPTMKCGLPDG